MILIALVCFLAAAIWAVVLSPRAWPLALIAAGLLFYVLSGHPTLHV